MILVRRWAVRLLQAAYPALLRRFPDLRVAAAVEDIPFRDSMVVYGVHELPVRW